MVASPGHPELNVEGKKKKKKMCGLIGRAKRAPHWGCSIEISRDIYIYDKKNIYYK